MISEADKMVKEAKISKLKKDLKTKEFEVFSGTEIISRAKQNKHQAEMSVAALKQLIKEEEEGA